MTSLDHTMVTVLGPHAQPVCRMLCLIVGEEHLVLFLQPLRPRIVGRLITVCGFKTTCMSPRTSPGSFVLSESSVPASCRKMLYSEGDAVQYGVRLTCRWTAVALLYRLARFKVVPLHSSAAVLASLVSYAVEQDLLS